MNNTTKTIRTCLHCAFLLLLFGSPSLAQQFEIGLTDFQQFSYFGPGKNGGMPTGPVIHRGRGPGSVSFGATATAKFGPSGSLMNIYNVNPLGLILFDLNVEMSSGLSGPTSIGSDISRNRCNMALGNLPDFLVRMNDFGVTQEAISEAIRDYIPTGSSAQFGAFSCSVFHSDGFGSLSAANWALTVTAASNGAEIARVGIPVGGGVSVTGLPNRLLDLPGNLSETLQYRFACLDGLVWNDIENQCVCDNDNDRFPPGQNPLDECNAGALACGPRQVVQDGSCLDCPPNNIVVNNTCVPLDDGDDGCETTGSPCFCALHPDHSACAQCEWTTDTIYYQDEIFEFGVVRCESTFPWTTSLAGDQAYWDCLYVDLVCYLSQFTKTVPDVSVLPPTGHLSTCSEGLGWRPCSDTDPNLRALVPADDHLDMFPECYVSSTGVAITTCGTTLPDGEPKPDLVIESPEILTTTPTTGEPLLISFNVANRGTEAAPNATWLVQATTPIGVRTLTGVIGSLAVEEQRTFNLSSEDLWFVPATGPHSFRVEVDHNQSLTELNENNNKRLMATLVTDGTTTGGIDLIANITGTTIENPVVDQEVTVFVTVTNVGQAPAPASVLLVSVTDPAGNWLPEQRNTGPLGPGQSVTESVIVNGDRAGSLWLTARADAGFDVDEDVESNNDATFGLQYAEPDVCLPCTSGAPDNGVGSTLCLPSWDDIEAEGGQFQCYGVRPDGTTCSPGGDHPNGWYSIGLRCPDPWTLCEGLHPDRCGIPDICPGTAVCD